MAVCEIHLGNQNALGKAKSLMAIVPENAGDGPFPVWYLLHGLSDNHTAWTRQTSIERYVSGLPIIVVMPDGERGFYTDAREGHNAAYETNIIRDVIGFVDDTFQTIPTREGRVVSGLSMGGYGAMKLALKHPHLFRAAVSHSGAIGFASRALSEIDAFEGGGWLREFIPIFGPDARGGSEDCFALAEKIERAQLPALRIDCGGDDFLIEENREFHAHLKKLGVAHEYEEWPGGHDWSYWDAHVQETIAFFARELGLQKK